MAQLKLRILHLVCVITLFSQSDAPQSIVEGSDDPVSAETGSDVTLPCHLEPPFDVNNMTVEWKRGSDHVHTSRNGENIHAEQDQRFKDRTQLFHQEMHKGNISLKLLNVTKEDEGVYTCSVPDLKSQVTKDNVKLIIVDPKRGDKVREKPDDPIVKVSHDPVPAETGSDVILQCQTKPPYNVSTMTVEWKQDSKTVHVSRNGEDIPEEQDPRFKDRTKLDREGMHLGIISLKLFNVTKEDAGVYTCSVPDLKSQVTKGNVTLIIESIVEGSDDPVSAETGSDVILPCHLEPPFDVNNMTVEWKQGSHHVHMTRKTKDIPEEQHPRFKDRTQLDREEMHKGNISLKLLNVTKEDEGVYTCSVPKLKSKVTKDNVKLIIVEPKNEDEVRVKPDEPKGLSTGAIVGIVLGVIIIIAIIAFFIRRKCRAGHRRNAAQQNEQVRPNVPEVRYVAAQQNDEDQPNPVNEEK